MVSSIFFPYARIVSSRAGLDLRDDREAVARGSPGEDRAVSSLFLLEESLLRDRLGGGLRPVVLHVSLPAFLVAGLRPVLLDFRVVHRHGSRPIVVLRGG